MKNIVKDLEAYIKERGLKKGFVARALEMSGPQLSHVLKGRRGFTERQLLKLKLFMQAKIKGLSCGFYIWRIRGDKSLKSSGLLRVFKSPVYGEIEKSVELLINGNVCVLGIEEFLESNSNRMEFQRIYEKDFFHIGS